MQGKKRYFVIVLFLLLGLTTFTFASPREFSKSQKPKNGTSEKVSNDTQARKSYAEAVEAVEEAEEDPTLETVENARLEIQNADDATDDQVTQLQNRVNVVENTIDVAALVSELEELVKAKETFDTASLKYPTADTEVNKLEEGNVKENLVTRLERVEKILNDSSKPVYTGVTNNQITNENVKLVVTDDTEVTKTVTLNNEVVDFKEEFQEEGVYVVTLVDEAFNEETVTFTIDKTAPKFVDLKSGNHYETITVLVDDETAIITVLNNDTKVTTNVTSGAVLTEDATYKLTVKDAAGNSKSIWVAIDTTKPTITGVTNGSVVNKSEKIYVKDKFLTNVQITGPNSKGTVITKEFTRSDFEVGTNNENFSFEYKANYEGEWTVVATDKAGNTYSETFTIDRTAAKKNAVNANVNGYKNEVKEQYATNGNTVTAYISVNEELKHNPTFTFYTNGKEVKVVGKEEVVASVRDNHDYPYVYTAKLVINEELVAEDGEITFTVTDIYDKAGNQTADITKMSVGNKVLTLDRTPNRVTFTTISTDNENVDGKVYYVTDGDTVTFRMGVREKFSENPVVTIAGKPVELTYVKYFAQPDHHEYRGTLKLDDTLTDGNLDITISNLTDEVGNKGFYYQTNGKKVLETITTQKTTNGKSLVYDNTAPISSYVAILSKGSNYLYAKNGDTIRFLVGFNEEVTLSDDFVITFNGKTKKLSRSGDKSRYEYIAEFKIPADEANLAEGLLTFEVKGFADKLGNLSSEVLTNATHNKYNKVTYDRTAPGLTVKSESIGVDPYYSEISYKLSDNTSIDYFEVNGKKVDVTNNQWGDANYSAIKGSLVAGKNTITLYDVAGNKTEKEFTIAKNTAKVEDGKVTVNEDIYLVNEPFYNVKENTSPVTINGNGKTVTQFVTDADKFNWTESWTRPTAGNMISSSNGSKMTVNDLTFAGTTQSIALGHYLNYKVVGLPATYNFNTEMNNVNIIGLKVASYSSGIAPAVVVYGTANFNNVNIYDTKLSELDTDPMWPVYDLALVNYSNATLNGGKIGSIYMWRHAKLTVKAGTTVDSINVTLGTPMTNIVVEEGATVNKVITKNGEMTYAEWIESTTPVGKLKLAAKTGGTYKLTEDLTLNAPLPIASDKELVIDLNNKELKLDNKTDSSERLIQNAGKLTIKNGTLTNEDIKVNGVIDNKGGEVTIEKLTIKDNGSNSSSTIYNESGKLTITDSEFNIVSQDTGCRPDGEKCGNTAIENHGDLVIKNTKITSDSGARYAVTTHSGNVEVDNVEINIPRRGGFAITGGNVDVKNATILKSYYYPFYVVNTLPTNVTIHSGNYSSSRSTIYLGKESETNDGIVTVNGGTFNTIVAKRTVVTASAPSEGQNFGLIIKGGTFKGTKKDVSAYVAEGFEQNSKGEVVAK